MPSFQKKTAKRIALVSITLACVASPLAWYIERENAEEATVALAMEESQRLLEQHANVFISTETRSTPDRAESAARAITGGLFDIAEIYNGEGQRLAEAMPPQGALIESQVPSHGRPTYKASSYESLQLPGGQWVLRIFVPVRLPRPQPRQLHLLGRNGIAFANRQAARYLLGLSNPFAQRGLGYAIPCPPPISLARHALAARPPA